MVRRNIGEIAAADASQELANRAASERRQIHFAGFTVDLACLSLARDGQPIELRRQS